MSILIDGALVDIPGVRSLPPASHGGPAWASLDHGDCRPRPLGTWIRQIIVHATGGRWPQPIIATPGPGGEALRYADIWRSDPAHSAAPLVADTAGTAQCLADVVRVMGYHAEASNTWSVGIEMVQLPDGSLHQATIDATAALIVGLADRLGIPLQIPRGPYRDAPIRRMETGTGASRRNLGGPDVVGVLGHRDNTSERGRGDPGDAIWTALVALGAEVVDYDGGEDLERGRARQRRLNELDAKAGNTWSPIVVDGQVGPRSIAAARRLGFARWRDVPA